MAGNKNSTPWWLARLYEWTLGAATSARQDIANVLLATISSAEGSAYSRDAGGRRRVSQLETLGDYKHNYGTIPLLMDNETIGTGTATYEVSKSHIRMTTSANLDTVIHQSKQWHDYQAGKSHNEEFLLSSFAVQTNIVKRFGYFSSNIITPFDSNKDGFYLESEGVTDNEVKFVIMIDNTITASISQSDWDVPIASYDWDKITVVDFDFLAGVEVRLFVEIDGEKQLVHRYDHAGIGTDVMFLVPNQPVRFEIRQMGAGSGVFDMVSAQVSSEGSVNRLGITGSVNTTHLFINANTVGTAYAIAGIKLKANKRGVEVIPESVSINSIGNNKNYFWQLLLNPTIAGTFVYTDKTNYELQSAVGDTSGNPSTNTVTGGVEIDSGYADSSSPISSVFNSVTKIGSTVDGVMDTLVLVVIPQTTNQDISGGFVFLQSL